MHIRKQIRKYLILIFAIVLSIMIINCKGKEKIQPTEAPVTSEWQEKTDETQSIPSPKRPEDIKLQPGINSAPRITKFNVVPKNPAVGDTIQAEVETYDKDEDTVTITYQWARNDAPLEVKANMLILSGEFKRGDKISVKATPDDHKVNGVPLTMVVYIANAAPVLKSVPEAFRLDGGLYIDQIKATDPDGDRLTFILKEAPTGMTIDPEKGFVRWKVPPQVVGKSQYTFSVTDDHGGETIATITLDIKTRQSEVKP